MSSSRESKGDFKSETREVGSKDSLNLLVNIINNIPIFNLFGKYKGYHEAKLLDIIMDAYFENQAIKFKDTLEKTPEDCPSDYIDYYKENNFKIIQDQFLQFSMRIAVKMKYQRSKIISYNEIEKFIESLKKEAEADAVDFEKDMAAEFVINASKALKLQLAACPFARSGDKFRFIHPGIQDYLVARASYESELRDLGVERDTIYKETKEFHDMNARIIEDVKQKLCLHIHESILACLFSIDQAYGGKYDTIFIPIPDQLLSELKNFTSKSNERDIESPLSQFINNFKKLLSPKIISQIDTWLNTFPAESVDLVWEVLRPLIKEASEKANLPKQLCTIIELATNPVSSDIHQLKKEKKSDDISKATTIMLERGSVAAPKTIEREEYSKDQPYNPQDSSAQKSGLICSQ